MSDPKMAASTSSGGAQIIPKRIKRDLVPIEDQPFPSFRVVSYNILADIYVTGNSKYADHFARTPNAMPVSYRWPNLLEEILEFQPDIVALQECAEDAYLSFFQPKLAELGYESKFKKKPIWGPGVDGCATFFLSEKFTLVKDYSVEYAKLIKPVVHKKKGAAILNKDQVALVTVLRYQAGDARPLFLCVANTHVIANRSAMETKMFQAIKLMEGLQKFQKLHIPVILATDFNSWPRSNPVRYVTEGIIGRIEVRKDDKNGLLVGENLFHGLLMNSVYELPEPLQPGKILVEDPARGGLSRVRCIDYIFYTRDMLFLRSRLDDQAMHEMKQSFLMPNEEYSSDHFALIGDFSFLPMLGVVSASDLPDQLWTV